MVEESVARRQLYWWWPPFAALLAVVLFLPMAIYSPDFGKILYVLVSIVVGLVLLTITVSKMGPQRLMALTGLVIYCVLSWWMVRNYIEGRSEIRWFLGSKRYKAELLGQPASSIPGMRHMEWDGWGWAGMNTDVYLVFDPSNSLAEAANSHSPGKFNGIPCAVPRVHRLESKWYSVEFYTSSGWDQCS